MTVMVRAGEALAVGLVLSNLSVQQFWMSYFAMGGQHLPSELVAYIGGEIALSAAQHDRAAHAVNEKCVELGLGSVVRYSCELTAG